MLGFYLSKHSVCYSFYYTKLPFVTAERDFAQFLLDEMKHFFPVKDSPFYGWSRKMYIY